MDKKKGESGLRVLIESGLSNYSKDPRTATRMRYFGGEAKTLDRGGPETRILGTVGFAKSTDPSPVLLLNSIQVHPLSLAQLP